MTHRTHTLIASVLLIIGAFPSLVHADLIQNHADTRTSEEYKSVGGWSQDLGSGLSGTLTRASFPIRFSPSAIYGPRFQLRLDIFPDETYSTEIESLGSIQWPWTYAQLHPLAGTEQIDTTLSFAIPEEDIQYSFIPDYAYRLSLELSNARSGGAFQVYGSSEDSYVHGSTSAAGIKDMAFTLFGVDRAVASSTIETPTLASVSSVLFLPGIKGSRLYREDADCEDCERLLWEPYSDEAIEELMLTEDGVSEHEDVYVHDEDIISEVLGNKFYASFVQEMDTAESDDTYGTAWEWKPISYDWRLSLDALVNNGAEEGGRIYYARATSTPYIEQTLRRLAATSPTGKVTIVAHSNGGLVAKALMQKLGASDSAELIDDVIFVGVPQIGAPQALGALLYGYGEALPFNQCADSLVIGWLCGLFVDRPTARTFAENAPMGYHLLPSDTYVRFGATDEHPIARFSASELYAVEREKYGNTIDTTGEMYDFLLGKDGGRLKPEMHDLETPNILSEQLISYARAIHESIDLWKPSEPIRLHQIAGWGAPTVSGIEFYEEPRFLGRFGDMIPRYRPLFSQDGDGVVPQYSATPLSGGFSSRYWINLPDANEGSDTVFTHSNLFELSTLKETVHAILTDTPLPDTLLRDYPGSQDQRSWRVFLLHSPLSLELYDMDGNHIGENTEGTFDTNIPEATYGEFGEVKYLIVPADQSYTLELEGKDSGSFSLDIQELKGGKVRTTTTLANIPATIDTLARMEVGENLASSTLQLDYDGDSTIDASMTVTVGSRTLYDGSVPQNSENSPSEEENSEISDTVEDTSSKKNGQRVSRGNPATQEQEDVLPQQVITNEMFLENLETSPTLEQSTTSSVEVLTTETMAEEIIVPSAVSNTTELSAAAVTSRENVFWRFWEHIVEKVKSLIQLLIHD